MALDGEIKLPNYETIKFVKDNKDAAPVTVTVEDGNIIKNVDVQNGYMLINGTMAINDTLTLENITGNGRVTVNLQGGNNSLNVGGNVYVDIRTGNDKVNITGDGVTVRADERSLITYNNQSLRADQGYAEVIFLTADGLIEPKGSVTVSGDNLSNFMLSSESKINCGSNVTIVDSAIKDSFNFNAQNKSSLINLKNIRVLENSTATISGGTADDTINVDNVKGKELVMINGGGKNFFNIVGSTAAVSLAEGDKVTLDDSAVMVYFGKLEKYDVERYGVIIADGKSTSIDDPVILEVHDDYIQILGGTGIIAEGFVHDEYNFLRDKNGVRIIDLYTNSQLTTMPISKGVVGNYVNITAGNTPYVFEKKPNEGQTFFFMDSKLLSNIIAEENVTVTVEDGSLNFSGKGSVNLDNNLFNRFSVKVKLSNGMQLRVADTDPPQH